MQNVEFLRNRTFGISVSVLSCLTAFVPLNARTLQAQTAVPVAFTHSIDAKNARSGDLVTAKTMQTVVLANGEQIPKGGLLLGHVVASSAFHYDETPYAVQAPSTLDIHFDSLMDKGQKTPVDARIRALANAVESWTAETPHYLGDSDHVGTMELIGGGEYSPLDEKVMSNDADSVIGYNKKQGVYARLLPAVYTGRQGSFRCEGTQAEQAVGIFSPEACGIYGFSTVSISREGADGTFRLASAHGSVKLYAGSTALLEVQASR